MFGYAGGSINLLFHFAILVDGQKAALFTQLIAYLALISIGVWSLVLTSTVLRVLVRRIYKLRTQRRTPTEIN